MRIKPADKKGKDAGIQRLLERMETGRFKVFKSCEMFLKEFRNYRYDEKTLKVVKTDDHLCDAVRYASGSLQYAEPPHAEPRPRDQPMDFGLGI